MCGTHSGIAVTHLIGVEGCRGIAALDVESDALEAGLFPARLGLVAVHLLYLEAGNEETVAVRVPDSTRRLALASARLLGRHDSD
jgi:hypothetical protein